MSASNETELSHRWPAAAGKLKRVWQTGRTVSWNQTWTSQRPASLLANAPARQRFRSSELAPAI